MTSMTRRAVMLGYDPDCLREGFVAQGMVDIQSNNTFKNGFCIHSNTVVKVSSGNVFELPVGRTNEEEVRLRRHLAREVVKIITAADTQPRDSRAAFVRERLEALQQDVLAQRHA